MQDDSDLIPISGIWINKSEAGNTYLSGSLGDARLLAFENDEADGDNAPDWQAYIAAGEHGSDDADLVPLGGLWLNQSQNGRQYMAGYLGSSRMLVFRNYDKTPDSNEPDYELFATRKPDRDGGDGGRQREQGDEPINDGDQGTTLAPQPDGGASEIDSPF